MSVRAASSSPLGRLRWAESPTKVDPVLPLDELLIAGQFMATDEDRVDSVNARWTAETPGSMQVIKAGVLSITKSWSKYIAGLGGGVGILSMVSGGISAFATDVGALITVVLISAGSLLLSATIIALALFIAADVQARGTATASRHLGRAEVISSYLRASTEISNVQLESLGQSSDQATPLIRGGVWIRVSDVKGFTLTP